MIQIIRGGLGLMGCLALLAGCGSRDPYARDDVWYPTNANAANLAAMAVNPNDLVTGHGDPKQSGAAHVLAVERIKTDNPRKPPAGHSTTSGL